MLGHVPSQREEQKSPGRLARPGPLKICNCLLALRMRMPRRSHDRRGRLRHDRDGPRRSSATRANRRDTGGTGHAPQRTRRPTGWASRSSGHECHQTGGGLFDFDVDARKDLNDTAAVVVQSRIEHVATENVEVRRLIGTRCGVAHIAAATGDGEHTSRVSAAIATANATSADRGLHFPLRGGRELAHNRSDLSIGQTEFSRCHLLTCAFSDLQGVQFESCGWAHTDRRPILAEVQVNYACGIGLD